jgi:UDP-3-O-[3-hydroxymyristoyl] glucosamine N-acyltransferase
VTLAGQVGIADHLHLGDDCRVGAKSGVNRSLAGGQDYLGFSGRGSQKIHAHCRILEPPAGHGQALAALEKELEMKKTPSRTK